MYEDIITGIPNMSILCPAHRAQIISDYFSEINQDI